MLIAKDMGRTLRSARGLRAYVLRSENLHHRHARACRANKETEVSNDMSHGSFHGYQRAGVSDREGWAAWLKIWSLKSEPQKQA